MASTFNSDANTHFQGTAVNRVIDSMCPVYAFTNTEIREGWYQSKQFT